MAESDQKGENVKDVILSAFLVHRWLLLFGVIFAGLTIVTALCLGAQAQEFLPFILYPQSYSKYLLFIPLAVVAFHMLACIPLFIADAFQFSVTHAILAYITEIIHRIVHYFKSCKFWQGAFGFLSMIPLSLFFCIGKSMIPHITTYRWDPAFAVADHWVHFGHYPHEFLVAIVEKFSLYSVPEQIYFLYFLALSGAGGYCMFFDKNHHRRLRFFYASWIGWVFCGLILATIFASTGPIFYGDFYEGVSPYKDFTDYLFTMAKKHSVLTIVMTRELYEMTTDTRVMDINAISAMPSMHVGDSCTVDLLCVAYI